MGVDRPRGVRVVKAECCIYLFNCKIVCCETLLTLLEVPNLSKMVKHVKQAWHVNSPLQKPHKWIITFKKKNNNNKYIFIIIIIITHVLMFQI